MSTATCPACGVAVVPGYIKCPKCHKPLPKLLRAATSAGGTAVERTTPMPIGLMVGGGVVILVLILFFAFRGGKHEAAAQPTAAPVQPTAAPVAQAPAPSTDIAPAAVPVAPPSPDVAASQLEHQLKHQRLWATVEVVGDHVDVRSGLCNDPGMTPLVSQSSAAFKAAGMTHVRCLEQSGHVVFDRSL